MKLNSMEERNFIHDIQELLQSDAVHEMNEYIQHGNITTLTHCLVVAYYSYWISLRIPLILDYQSIARGALLHDFYLYDWHIPDRSHRLHGLHHPDFALANAKKHFHLNNIEKDIIINHMWPLTITKIPTKKEAMLVCIVDKFCSLAETLHIPILPTEFYNRHQGLTLKSKKI